MIGMQVDALGGVFNMVTQDAGEVADLWSGHNEAAALLPIVSVAGIPGLLVHEGAFGRVLFHEVAKLVFGFNLGCGAQVFFNDAVALNQSACAVADADARAISAIKGVTPLGALGSVIYADTHVVPNEAMADAAVLTLSQGDGTGLAAVVDHADIFDHEVAALDGDDALISSLHLSLRPGEGEVTNFCPHSVFDLDDGLGITLLNDATWTIQAAASSPNADFLRDGVIASRDEDQAARIGVEGLLNRGIGGDGELGSRGID